LALARGADADTLLARKPEAALARLRGAEAGLLFDAYQDPTFCQHLLGLIAAGKSIPGRAGQLIAFPTPDFVQACGLTPETLEPAVRKTEQNNTVIVYGNRASLKLFRCTEDTINPDLEINRFLAQKARFPQVPQLTGTLEYRPLDQEPMTVG